MKKFRILLTSFVLVFFLISTIVINNTIVKVSVENNDIKTKLKQMTLEEKLEQMIIIDLPYIYEGNNKVDFTKVTESVKEFF